MLVSMTGHWHQMVINAIFLLVGKTLMSFQFQVRIDLLRGKGPLNTLTANITKWSNTFKQFAISLLTDCLSVSDHFVGLILEGLNDGLSLKKVAFEMSSSKICLDLCKIPLKIRTTEYNFFQSCRLFTCRCRTPTRSFFRKF